MFALGSLPIKMTVTFGWLLGVFMNLQQRVLCRTLTCFPLKISEEISHHKIGGKNIKILLNSDCESLLWYDL